MNPLPLPCRRGTGRSRTVAAVAVLVLACTVSTSCVSAGEGSPGMEALRAARETLGGEAFEEVQNIRLVSETRSRTSQGPVTLPFAMVVTTDGRFRLERGLRDGTTLTVANDGEQMMIRNSQGIRSASTEMRRRITGQLWWRLAYLFVNMDRGELEVTDQGTTKVSATTYRQLQVSPPESSPFVLLLHSESMRPARVRYPVPTPLDTVDVTEVYHEFRDVSGLRLPHRMVTYRGEQASSETVYTTVETNVELEEGYFSLGG